MVKKPYLGNFQAGLGSPEFLLSYAQLGEGAHGGSPA